MRLDLWYKIKYSCKILHLTSHSASLSWIDADTDTGVVLDMYMGTHIKLSKLGGDYELDTIAKDNFKPKHTFHKP